MPVLLKARVWTKIIVLVLLFIYTVTFIAKNSSEPVKPWLFPWFEPQTSVLLLALFAFLAGVAVTLLLRTILRTLRQLQEVRKQEQGVKLQRDVATLKEQTASGRP